MMGRVPCGTPHPRLDGVPPISRMGYPHPELGRGTLGYPLPIQDWMGYPSVQTWDGEVPPSRSGVTLWSVEWGTSPVQTWDGGGTSGYPLSKTGWGIPPISKASNCYVQNGVPPSRPGKGYPGVYPPHPRLDGVPPVQTWDGGVPPSRSVVPSGKLNRVLPLFRPGTGVPQGTLCPRLDGASPISKASTCYVAGSVPLAFTQEDFLVLAFAFMLTVHSSPSLVFFGTLPDSKQLLTKTRMLISIVSHHLNLLLLDIICSD